MHKPFSLLYGTSPTMTLLAIPLINCSTPHEDTCLGAHALPILCDDASEMHHGRLLVTYPIPMHHKSQIGISVDQWLLHSPLRNLEAGIMVGNVKETSA